MTKSIVYDTETTGKANFKLDFTDHSHPRLVQLGFVFCDDDTEEVIAHANFIVKPSGFCVPEGAAQVHGISTEYAQEVGIDLKTVLSIFAQYQMQADFIVAYNKDYDKRIMMAEYSRMQLPFFDKAISDWHGCAKDGNELCMMQSMTEVCAIPAQYHWQGKYKWPSLMESYQHLFGKTFDNAHDAMADVLATKDVYYNWLKNNKSAA